MRWGRLVENVAARWRVTCPAVTLRDETRGVIVHASRHVAPCDSQLA
jgi:hypothetical protein